MQLTISVEPAHRVQPTPDEAAGAQVADVEELAALNQIPLQVLYGKQEACGRVTGFALTLPRGRQRTVLVVDDNEDALHFFQRLLIPHHYHMLAARSGEEALAHTRQITPDAILLDLMIPEQDGWDLLQLFRSRDNTRSTPVIVCSALRQAGLALALGADAFIEKPIDEEALLGLLRRFIG